MYNYTHVVTHCEKQAKQYQTLAYLISNAPKRKRIYTTVNELLGVCPHNDIEQRMWVTQESKDILRLIRMMYNQALRLYPHHNERQHQTIIARAYREVATLYTRIQRAIDSSPTYPKIDEDSEILLRNVFQPTITPLIESMLRYPYTVIATDSRLLALHEQDMCVAYPETCTKTKPMNLFEP